MKEYQEAPRKKRSKNIIIALTISCPDKEEFCCISN
jgi:hypothetical protein